MQQAGSPDRFRYARSGSEARRNKCPEPGVAVTGSVCQIAAHSMPAPAMRQINNLNFDFTGQKL